MRNVEKTQRSRKYRRIAALIAIFVSCAISGLPQGGTQGLWTPIPTLPAAQAFQTATVLPDNSIVEAGGLKGTDTFWPHDSTAAAAWYLPNTNTWLPLPPMSQFLHAAAPTQQIKCSWREVTQT